MDHLTTLAPAATELGILCLPIPFDLPLPWVAADDVATELACRVVTRSREAEVVGTSWAAATWISPGHRSPANVSVVPHLRQNWRQADSEES